MKIPEIVLKICSFLQDKKADDISIADSVKMPNVASYNIIATATSTPHTKALADYVEVETLKLNEIDLINREGFNLSEWIILDFGEIFVHIFTKEKREHFNLEKLFNEGNNIKSFEKIQKVLIKQEKEKKEKEKQSLKKAEKAEKTKTKKTKKIVKEKKVKEKKPLKQPKEKKVKPVKEKKTKVVKEKNIKEDKKVLSKKIKKEEKVLKNKNKEIKK